MLSDFDNNDARGLKLLFIDGTEARLSRQRPYQFFFDPSFLKFFSISVLLAAFLEGRGSNHNISNWETTLLWSAMGTSMFIWLLLCGLVLGILLKKHLISMLFVPFITISTVCVSETTSLIMTDLLFESSFISSDLILQNYTRGVAIVVLYELFLASFVLPQLKNVEHTSRFGTPLGESRIELEHSAEKASGSDNLLSSTRYGKENGNLEYDRSEGTQSNTVTKELKIGSETFLTSELNSITVEDHYLKVNCENRTVTIRGKLSALAGDLEDLGFQINRSVWLAYKIVQSAKQTNGNKLTIYTTLGKEYKVARLRSSNSLECLKKQKIDLISGVV